LQEIHSGPNILQNVSSKDNLASLVTPSANSYFLHAYSALLLPKVLERLRRYYDEDTKLENLEAPLVYLPFEDRILFLTCIFRAIILLN
jgi:hypothetical protein